MTPATTGFRVKSGWAVAVLVAGTRTAPRVIERAVVQLADPAVPESMQPYHAALERHRMAAANAVRRLTALVERFAAHSLSELFGHYADHGYGLRGAAIVVGSVIDPQTIANDHIRAHALEGQLFRGVIERAVEERRYAARVFVEKELVRRGGETLRVSEPELRRGSRSSDARSADRGAPSTKWRRWPPG